MSARSEMPAMSDAPPTAQRTTDDHHEAESALLAAALSARTAPWKPVLAFAIIGVGIAGVVIAGSIPKRERAERLTSTASRLEGIRRRVLVGPVRAAPPTRTITLPASLSPATQVSLLPQATGFIRERRADIGDVVHKGDVLAQIDVPLLTEDRAAAKAALAVAVATRDQTASQLSFAEASLARATAASDGNAVTPQEMDERTANARTLRASLDASEATIRLRTAELARLDQEITLATVTAPFDGTITDRSIEVGDYVEPSSSNTARSMFRIADLSSLRVFVDVPQAYAAAIRPGLVVTVSLPGARTREVKGAVTRTSVALDASSRALRVEVTVPNGDGSLLANAYGEVKFEIDVPRGTMLVPGSAILLRANGAKIAFVDGDHRLHYAQVTLGRDLGVDVEVVEGLRGDERIVTNAGDEFEEGVTVDPVDPPPPPPPPAPAKPAATKT